MLDLLARHSRIDITVKADGDLHVDHHHTTEDVGIALGQAVKQALGDMAGITRYASVHMPMDETLSRVVIDISGRPVLVFKVAFPRDKVGEFDTELVREWFKAFAMNAGMTLHVETLYGENSHHIAESCFKGLARALADGGCDRSARRGRGAVDQGSARRLNPIIELRARNLELATCMPVYTAFTLPRPHAASTSARDAISFVFVRDGFHFWAFVFGPLWLDLASAVAGADRLYHRCDRRSMSRCAARRRRARRFLPPNVLAADPDGTEAASLQRWTLSRAPVASARYRRRR